VAGFAVSTAGRTAICTRSISVDEVWLHRECQDAWRDLDIPRALDRRGEIPISRPKDEGKKGQKESPEKPEVKIEIGRSSVAVIAINGMSGFRPSSRGRFLKPKEREGGFARRLSCYGRCS